MKETAKNPLHRYIQFFLTGFAVFDIIHLVCAITLLIIAYAERPINAMEGAECLVEIVFSILLICFINAMQHHHKYLEHPQMTYTLGYLTASASLFVPLSFSLPEIIEGEWSGSFQIAASLITACIAIAFLCFLFFFLALVFSRNPGLWRAFVIAGLCAMIVLVPIQFAMEFYTKEQAVILTFHLIKSVAPLAFAPLGISLVAHKESRTVFFRDLN